MRTARPSAATRPSERPGSPWPTSSDATAGTPRRPRSSTPISLATPDDAEALAGAGLNALKLGRSEEAEQFLDRAITADPSNFEALKGLSQIAEQDGRLDRALDALEAAAEVEPDDPEIAYRRSLLLARLGRPDEAARLRNDSDRLRLAIEEITNLRDALILAPDDVDLEYRTARWLIEHKHADEGVRWAEKALEDAPGTDRRAGS